MNTDVIILAPVQTVVKTPAAFQTDASVFSQDVFPYLPDRLRVSASLFRQSEIIAGCYQMLLIAAARSRQTDLFFISSACSADVIQEAYLLQNKAATSDP